MYRILCLISCFLLITNTSFGIDNVKYLKQHFANVDRYEPEKFANDPFFRTAFEVFRGLIHDPEKFFQEYTYMIVKPDALAFGGLKSVIDVCEELGFSIVAYQPFRYDSRTVKIFWYEESAFFPPEWSQVFSLVLAEKDSVVFLLKRNEPNAETACEALNKKKGHALSKYRTPDTIRSRIGAKDGPFAFIHIPEHPLAMIRELGVIFEENLLRELLSQGQTNVVCKDEVLAHFASSCHHDLDFASAQQRLLSWANLLNEDLRKEFYEYVNQEHADWKEFILWLKKNDISVPEWDLITFCIHHRSWQ